MPGIVAGCYYLLRLLPSKGGCATTFCTHLSSATFQHFGTSITNAYSTHFVKSFGLNAKANFHYPCCVIATAPTNSYRVGQNRIYTPYMTV